MDCIVVDPKPLAFLKNFTGSMFIKEEFVTMISIDAIFEVSDCYMNDT